MKQAKTTIRLIYPQWQGGDINHWLPEIPNSDDAARGYYLGAQLLNFLAPDSGQKTVTVPVSTDISEPMPRIAIRLKNMLSRLPLLK